jgi:hypothetical protein
MFFQILIFRNYLLRTELSLSSNKANAEETLRGKKVH